MFTEGDQNIKNLLLRSNKPVTPKNIKKTRSKDKLGSFCSPNLTRIGKVVLLILGKYLQ